MELQCRHCGAPLVRYKDNPPTYRCTRCGMEQEREESDRVTTERIRASVELGTKNIEKETTTAIHQFELQKKKQTWKQVKTIIFISIFIVVLVAGGFLGYNIYFRKSHENDVKIPLDSNAYCNRDYQDTIALLTDVGFLSVEEDMIADLSKAEAKKVNIVTQVSINGKTTFSAEEWFPNNARVRVTYHTIDPEKENQLEIPLSSVNCIGKDFSMVSRTFTDAGFTIEPDVHADLTREKEEQDGKVSQITVGNRSEFVAGDWVDEDTVVSIIYHILDPERATDIMIPGDSEQYIGQNYITVCDEFESAGFSDIILIPLYDRTIFDRSDPSLTESVLLNGSDAFMGGKWVPYDSSVVITYHADELKYTGKPFSDVEDAVRDLGFIHIVLIALDDLDYGDKNADQVTSVTVDNVELSEAASFHRYAEVVISYHSERTLTDTRVAVTVSSGDLSGEDYQSVVELLKGMGFVNVSAVGLEDIGKLTGFVFTEGSVKTVAIDGRTRFDTGTIFERDAEVVVSYHSLKGE